MTQIIYKDNYLKWKKALAGTPYEAELAAMSEEEQEESFFQSLQFGTAGMRGIMGIGSNRINLFTVRRAAKGLAEYVKKCGTSEKGIVIAYDSRYNSAEFAKETALVLAASGVPAYLFSQLQSVPLLSFAILQLHCAAGVVITASHNQKQYNGFKVYGPDGGQVNLSDAQEITREIDAIEDFFSILPMDERESIQCGLLRILGDDIEEAYYAQIKKISPDWDLISSVSRDLRIVYTPLFGSGYRHVTRLFHDMGLANCFIVQEQTIPDGNFPGLHAPNPELESTFTLAKEYARKHQADFIIATDPDSDRMGITVRRDDGSFLTLTGNQIGCLLMDYICERQKNNLSGKFTATSIVTTRLAGRIATHYGVEMREVLTGFRFVAELIKNSPPGSFLYAFEESYGYLEGDFIRDKDGIMSAVFLVQAAAYHRNHGRTLWQALNWLYEKYGYFLENTLSITAEGMKGRARISGFLENLRANPPKQLGNISVANAVDFSVGQKNLPSSNVLLYDLVDFSRVVLRPSGTEPKIKAYCFVTAPQQSEAEEKLAQLTNTMRALLEHL